MRLALLLVLLSTAISQASTITDPFAQPQNNCNYSTSSPYSSCDVIGNPQLFDIQKLDVTLAGGQATVTLYFNSGAVAKVGNQLRLSSFTVGSDTLIPGDLFFTNPTNIYDPTNPSTSSYLKYGVPLVNHGSFTAGDLYAIGGGISVETAQQALNDSSNYYRRNEAVLMTGSGTPASTGSVSVANYGDGISNALYSVTIVVPATSGLMSLIANNQIGILFSSADCGNDVIQGIAGTPPSVPEPQPIFMVLGGMGLILMSRVWRKATAKSPSA
jgi:hypothetical protein